MTVKVVISVTVVEILMGLILFIGIPSQSYVASSAIRGHTVLPACRRSQVNAPHLNPSQAGWYLIHLPQWDRRLS